MTYENIKSIILSILIVTSLLLTWNLWTYQPNRDELEKSNVIQEVSLSPEKEMKDIVKAKKIIFHIENQYYGTIQDLEVEKVMNEMRNWSVGNFENISSEVESISKLTDRNDMVEILYPGYISMDIYKSILPIKDKDVPNFKFDQIVINTDVQEKENGVVYFISQEDGQIYKSSVPSSSISEFKQRYYEYVKQQFIKQVPYKLAEGRTVYLPEGETVLDSYQYLFKELDSDKFKNALFSDPSLVQKNYISTGEEFTDGQSLMRENLDSSMIYYVNPAVVENVDTDSKGLIKKSIDFVNEHGGWTDNYRFVGVDNDEKTVLFRLYEANGYPIFGENDTISEIRLSWGETDISRYVRNNFSLGLLTQSNKVKLSTGPEIVNQLMTRGYNLDRLENIVIGYQMRKDAQSLLIYLEPCWYFLYDGVWQPLTSGGMGGENFGLE